jgi:hypothetical protein
MKRILIPCLVVIFAISILGIAEARRDRASVEARCEKYGRMHERTRNVQRRDRIERRMRALRCDELSTDSTPPEEEVITTEEETAPSEETTPSEETAPSIGFDSCLSKDRNLSSGVNLRFGEICFRSAYRSTPPANLPNDGTYVVEVDVLSIDYLNEDQDEADAGKAVLFEVKQLQHTVRTPADYPRSVIGCYEKRRRVRSDWMTVTLPYYRNDFFSAPPTADIMLDPLNDTAESNELDNLVRCTSFRPTANRAESCLNTPSGTLGDEGYTGPCYFYDSTDIITGWPF